MKILYLTIPSFFDLEISLIRELSKICEVQVMLIVSPESMRSSAFALNKLHPECAIIKALDYAGMEKYASLINMDQWLIANNPTNSVLDCWRLAQMIRRHIRSGQFDLIHSSTGCKTSLFLLPTIWKYPAKLLSVHDPIPHETISIAWKLIKYDLLLLSYGNVLLFSDTLEEKFRMANRGRFKQIYHSGLSVYDFLSSFQIDINPYGKYILFFGRIERYKGVELLVDAFKTTEAYQNGIKLVIAGKDNIDSIKKCSDSQIVFLNRYIPNEELATLIFHCQFVVLPYLSATQSGCVFSAYAFNKPILGTNVGDLPKQIDEKVGHIIEPNDKAEVARGIDYMLQSDLLAKSRNIALRYSSNGEKSWRLIAKNLYETYKTIVNGTY